MPGLSEATERGGTIDRVLDEVAGYGGRELGAAEADDAKGNLLLHTLLLLCRPRPSEGESVEHWLRRMLKLRHIDWLRVEFGDSRYGRAAVVQAVGGRLDVLRHLTAVPDDRAEGELRAVECRHTVFSELVGVGLPADPARALVQKLRLEQRLSLRERMALNRLDLGRLGRLGDP